MAGEEERDGQGGVWRRRRLAWADTEVTVDIRGAFFFFSELHENVLDISKVGGKCTFLLNSKAKSDMNSHVDYKPSTQQFPR